jgi:hypothetical protein
MSSRTNHQQQNQSPAAAAAQSMASSSRTNHQQQNHAAAFQHHPRRDSKRCRARIHPRVTPTFSKLQKYSKSYFNLLEKDFSSFSK